MRKTLFFILISCTASFAQVQLEIQYNGKLESAEVKLYKYTEFITNSTEQIGNDYSLAKANTKSLDLDLNQPSRLLIKDNMRSRKFYVQPGNSYKLTFDDDSIYIESEDEINKVMEIVEARIKEYFKENYKIELDDEKNKKKRTLNLLEDFVEEIESKDQGSEFQKQLIKYRIANMEAGTYSLLKEKNAFDQLASTYVFDQKVQFQNQSYIYFLKDYYFRKFLSFQFREKKYSQKLNSFEVAKLEVEAIPNKICRQIVLINYITEAFNSSWGNSNLELIQILDSLSEYGLHEQIKLASKNLSARFSKLGVGSEVPDFKMTNLSGDDLKLSDFHGKYVLLDFWFIGCAPCHRGIPYIKKLNDEFGECLSIIGINPINDTEEITRYKEKNNLTWHLPTIDKNDQTLTDLNIAGYPTYYLLDPNRKILLIPEFTGKIEDQFSKIEEELKRRCQ